jgi:hypothetical protein
VGNEVRSIEDFIDCQEGNNENSYFQVGKGSKMRLSESLKNSEESSYQQGMLTSGREAEERSHLYEYSCGFVDHVNEDDEKLNTSTVKEEYQMCILIIGGIKIFLPESQVDPSICVVYTIEEGQLAETVVITEISSAHGDKNSASSNSNEVIHGTELISQHCKRVKNYTK